ncbi:MAG: hypothetical protein BroJett040_07230 [Oligoflexia bacterium]|nr:MAG: hypothetical protein BroJett040_07230 [Oligoflexia bacterium]
MRTRIIPVLVIGLAALIMTPNLRGQKGALGKELTLRQSVDSLIMNSERNIKSSKGLQSKLKSLDKLEKEFKKLRQENARQHVADELYFDNFIGAVVMIPKKDFAVEKCSKYKTRILAEYDPSAKEGFENPAVQKALKILDALCE